MQNKRLEKLIKRYGFKTKNIAAIIDGRAHKRSDIKIIHWHGQWVYTIPSKVYHMRSPWNVDLMKRMQLSFKMCRDALAIKRYGKE